MVSMAKVATVFVWTVGILGGALAVYVLWFFAIPYFMAPDSLDRVEAKTILSSQLQHYRQKQYSDLVQLVDNSERKEIIGKSGVRYQLVVSAYWDGKPNDDVRIIAAIDDGGRSAWIPMTDSFILSSSGKFVGE